ncbi:hypothetical protein [Methylobacterium bullatum]|uniref:Uncharacterized protein n=1 Tax=Methylobacterium bullatum TaxID=570505 RepID=A0AAV4ZBZ1_9HYPH|nr:hypothetical protein [Methylobacterium bullatum]MBD8902804.1 hypothetical protein [Methylobacterium bullatum]GJD41288.1 hypothetical protein OICFNHDK_3771 [Methylobacterium bullatum]
MSETMNTQQNLPEGCECRLDFYLVSDTADVEVVVGLGGMTKVPQVEGVDKILAVVRSLGVATAPLEGMADDWRLMNRAEIADYKRRQEEDIEEEEF